MPEVTLTGVAICTLVAFVAGVIDAMAGGGGIFTMPALAALGLPVPVVAGTNKFAATGGSSAATVAFLLRGHLDRRIALIGGCCSLVGAVAVMLLPKGNPTL
ncbi:MAG: TSUP family transporter, partial [Phycisphaerae bacterium]